MDLEKMDKGIQEKEVGGRNPMDKADAVMADLEAEIEKQDEAAVAEAEAEAGNKPRENSHKDQPNATSTSASAMDLEKMDKGIQEKEVGGRDPMDKADAVTNAIAGASNDWVAPGQASSKVAKKFEAMVDIANAKVDSLEMRIAKEYA